MQMVNNWPLRYETRRVQIVRAQILPQRGTPDDNGSLRNQ